MYRREKWSISSYVVTLYVFIIFCIYPLYFENGYYNMGTAKCRFFLSVSEIAFFVLFATAILDIVVQKKSTCVVKERKKLSVTEKWLYLYMGCVLLSHIFSDFKQDVLWGAADWYMGTIPLLLMAFFSFFLMHIWEEEKWLKTGFLIVSSVVFLLGICNRFSFYPIPMEPHQGAFISTLGNINWLCGYMSVTAPIGIGIFMFSKDEDYRYKWQKYMMFFYVIIVFVLGFCQGSNSVFLWNGALFFVLLWISLKNTVRLKKWLLLVAMWGMSGQLVRILKTAFPEKYSYESALLVETNITLVIAMTAIFLYMVLHFSYKREKEFSDSFCKGICYNLLAVLVICILMWLVLAIYNTSVGVSFLADKPLFLLNEKWGNGRGIIFKTAFDLFGKMSPMQKLFGVGADGFSSFAYSIPEIQLYLQDYFGDSVLTNAHCEILTNMVNLGILGTAAYIGVFITFIIRCMEKGERKPYMYIPVLCVICYFANNLISFAQVLNIPYLFLILGIGEAYLKKHE